MHARRIAVAGFSPYGAHRVNPSEQVVRALARETGLATRVLPVAYRRATSELLAWLDAARPDAVLLLGRHDGGALRLERTARNRDEAAGPDEDGEARAGLAIAADGPAAYASTLPLDAFADALARLRLPFAWSDDAGGFLCNHVFYRARAWTERGGLAIPCGFVHLPPPEALALERQTEAVRACLAALASG